MQREERAVVKEEKKRAEVGCKTLARHYRINRRKGQGNGFGVTGEKREEVKQRMLVKKKKI